jgi:hypothetical protein
LGHSDGVPESPRPRLSAIPDQAQWHRIESRLRAELDTNLPSHQQWRRAMELILIIVVLVLLFGGGGYWGRRRGHW